MKRYLYILAAALTALLGSCEKEPAGNTDPVDNTPKDITLSATSFEAVTAGGDFSLTVTAPSRPKVTGEPDWITVKDGTYSNFKITYGLTVKENTTYEERTATLTVTSGSLSKTVSVKQAAAEKPEPVTPAGIDENLTNAKASAAAKKVYAFLREQAGSKVLSGVQSGGTANNNDRINEIFQKWVVNYGDISAAKEQWKNNGLVSFMWHWNVPNSEADWTKGKAGDFSGYNFYCDKTSFSIVRALQEGTWENEFILKDIEKVAGYLKLLQAEGIPVLWRPLHEAAGNYTLYGSNGAWFWWGRGGAEPCKKLWKLLRDKLEGEYGLDNLIWVWTLDATVGAEKDYASWYPGISGGHKLVTVSECGNIPDPGKCLSAGETWNWFLVWDLESYKLNTDAYWKSLMSSNRVLTREQMPSLK